MPKRVLRLTARVHMNERPLEGEGGRLVLHAEGLDRAKGLQQAELILNATTDAALAAYPEDREGQRTRWFEIVVREVEGP